MFGVCCVAACVRACCLLLAVAFLGLNLSCLKFLLVFWLVARAHNKESRVARCEGAFGLCTVLLCAMARVLVLALAAALLTAGNCKEQRGVDAVRLPGAAGIAFPDLKIPQELLGDDAPAFVDAPAAWLAQKWRN